ncbi:hypothetical protein [Mangrovibacterium sp.]|uniref:hypothetical protein n=1 Tax=Mangrovibacterium sp. TaxID=1961364 RepID=UPI00356403F6
MLTKDCFYVKTESGRKINPKSIQVISCYSPSYRLQAKDPELDDGPFKVLAIKCYKIEFEGYGEMYTNIIECLGSHGHVEELFYNTKSHDELIINDVYWGEVKHSGGFDKTEEK